MSFSIRIVSALVLATLLGAPARTLAQTKQHVAMTPADLKWGPAPPVLPPGAQIAVLDGRPGKDGCVTLRLKFPDGYKIAPHWHPTDENIVIVSGTFMMGLGEKRNEASMHALTPALLTILAKTRRPTPH